jgi:AbrB family looped-hinge helix DNA binding protein
MVTTIRVCKRGLITLPAKLRKKYKIQAGDTLHLIDLDGVFVLSPRECRAPELAREIECIRQESEVSMDELLQGLREQREQYNDNE